MMNIYNLIDLCGLDWRPSINWLNVLTQSNEFDFLLMVRQYIEASIWNLFVVYHVRRPQSKWPVDDYIDEKIDAVCGQQ